MEILPLNHHQTIITYKFQKNIHWNTIITDEDNIPIGDKDKFSTVDRSSSTLADIGAEIEIIS